MAKELEFSINGLPWTAAKINKIIASLKVGGTITFAFGFDDLKYLQILNNKIFQRRDDILFHIWSVADNRVLAQNELGMLANMSFVKRLKMSGFKNTSLSLLQSMDFIEELILAPSKKLDISFLQNFKNLKKLRLFGANSVDVLENNTNLEYLYLQTTIKSYEFARKLLKLKTVIIDRCISTHDFSPLNQPSIEYLGIHSLKMLDNIDSIAAFSHLKEFHLDAARIKTLPSLEKLQNLRKLKLGLMKVWENPDILKTIPNLEELEMSEVNTKLKADDFYFLKDMKSLKILDYRFIDFNKTRIEKLNRFFKENNMEKIIIKLDNEDI